MPGIAAGAWRVFLTARIYRPVLPLSVTPGGRLPEKCTKGEISPGGFRLGSPRGAGPAGELRALGPRFRGRDELGVRVRRVLGVRRCILSGIGSRLPLGCRVFGGAGAMDEEVEGEDARRGAAENRCRPVAVPGATTAAARWGGAGGLLERCVLERGLDFGLGESPGATADAGGGARA